MFNWQNTDRFFRKSLNIMVHWEIWIWIKSKLFRMKTFELIVLLVICSAALTSGKKSLIHTQHVGFLNINIFIIYICLKQNYIKQHWSLQCSTINLKLNKTSVLSEKKYPIFKTIMPQYNIGILATFSAPPRIQGWA